MWQKTEEIRCELIDKIVHGLNKDVKNFVVMKEEVTKYAPLGQSLTSVKTSSVCSVRSNENERKYRDISSYGDSDRNHYYQKPVSAAEGPTSKRREGQNHRQDRRRQRRPFQETCEHCGRCTHISSACKFKNATCYQCNQKGHLARSIFHIIGNRDLRLSLRVLGMGTKWVIMQIWSPKLRFA